MSDTSPAASVPTKSGRKGTIVLTVLATLAFVFILEKLLVPVRDVEDQARMKRSEALLAAQERRSKGYQEYYDRVLADNERVRALLSRQEKDAERFENILGTWERQQKAYQAYLDSLKPAQ
jgi:hypothetical protein